MPREAAYTEVRSIKCNQGALRAVRFNVDGDYIITSGSDRTIKLWSAERGALLSTYSGHSGEVLDARGSCDNAQILSSSTDKTATIWDVETSRPLRRLRAHNATVTTSIFNEDSTLAITGSRDNSVKIWDMRSKSNTNPIQTLEEPTDGITGLAVNNNGILVGSADSFTRFYDVRNGKLSVDCMGEAVTFVVISRDSASHLVSVADGTCKLIDKDTGQALACYKGFSNSNYNDYKIEATFDFSDSLILVGSPLSKVYVYELISEKILQEIGVVGPVVSIASHGTKDKFVCGSGGVCTLFDGDSDAGEAVD